MSRTVLAAFLMAATASAAVADEQEEQAYRMEIESPGEEWVVISYHYRHSDACTSFGCVIIGPTEDRDACQEWARAYSAADPTDHARCVSAEPYLILRY